MVKSEVNISETFVMIAVANFLLIKKNFDFVEINFDGIHKKQINYSDLLSKFNFVKSNFDNEWCFNAKKILIITNNKQPDIVGYKNNSRYFVECKKGNFINKKGNPEYSIFHVAVAQLLKIEINNIDNIAVAIPASDRLKKYIIDYLDKPLTRKIKLQALIIDENFEIDEVKYP
jgi:hypothetical protein